MSDLRDMIETIVRVVTKNNKYYGCYRFRVNEDKGPTTQTSRPDLVPVQSDLGLKPILATDKSFGSHGLFAKLKPGREVLVGFEGGDSNKPYIAAFLPGEAIGIELVVDNKVKVVGTIPGVAQPVALYQPFRTYLDTIEAYLLPLDTALNGLAGGALTPLIAARKNAALQLGSAMSNKLEAE